MTTECSKRTAYWGDRERAMHTKTIIQIEHARNIIINYYNNYYKRSELASLGSLLLHLH